MNLGALILAATFVAPIQIPIPKPSQTPQQAIGVQANQQSNGAGRADQGAKDGDNRTSQSEPSKPQVGGPKHSAECDHDCERRAEERSEYWIILGHRMKITDFLLSIFTFLLVCVGAITAAILRNTDASTAKNAEAALASASALVAAGRAYVFVKSFNPIWSEGNPNVQVVVLWANSGTTPTRNLRSWISWEPRDTPLPEDFGFQDINTDHRPPSQQFLGPKAEMNLLTCTLTLDQMRSMLRGELFFYIWGWAEYNDIFPDTPVRRTEFCNEIVATPRAGQENALVLQFRMHHTHNSAT
jgi:hypothetical protein